MSKTTDSSIFGKMTTRPAGKRQIKPTAILYATLTDNHSSDEEDEDFEVNTMESGTKTESEGSSEEDNSDEEESESEEDDDEDDDKEKSVEKQRSPSTEKELIVCGVCLNQRDVVVAGDFMQCDKCQIHVHESCYGCLPSQDPEETRWFCEPCQYGLPEPPHCEFCPSRYGAFKRADINGRWAHAICALFTHGVAYSQEHTYTGVSWRNLENSSFGRRVCSACPDKIEARFGIASRCESGMCKEYMHVTCAQKLGLLIDETDDSEAGGETIAVPRYFFCKKHSNQDSLKQFQRKFERWEKSEGKRITTHRRRLPLTPSEDSLRIQMRNALEKTLKDEDGPNVKGVVTGGEKPKQARLLNSSAEFFDRFETKAEDSGLSKKDFRDPFYNMKLTVTSHIPIGFSKEYIDFMHIRDSQIIPEEEEKLQKARELLAETKARQEKKSASKHLSDKFAANEECIEKKLESLEKLHSLLSELGGDGGILSEFTQRQSAERARGSPLVMAKEKEIYCCVVCKKNTEQHKQTQCDQCHKSYHIGCLEPPLTKLPKRNNFGWICHECNESSDSEAEIQMDLEEATTSRSVRTRRPPARLSAFN